MIAFHQINFGFSDGEVEAARSPELLDKGFFDNQGIIDELITGPAFLVLGYKGSGKTLIGEKLFQKSQAKFNWFCNKFKLGDFPFKIFGKILPDNQAENNNNIIAWEGVLLLALLKSATDNERFTDCLDGAEKYCLEELKKAGLLPSDNLRQLVSEVTKTQFKIRLPSILSAESSRASDYRWCFNDLIGKVKRMVVKQPEDARTFIVVDGLDEHLALNSSQSSVLSGLLRAAASLNSYFQMQRRSIKIVLLWRKDLFDEMVDPNKNKIRQDSSILLDWYHDPRAPEECMLVKLANLRANLSDSSVSNIFSSYFPEYIGNEKAAHYLLDRTRHSPRDFIQLLKEIQKASVVGRGLIDYSTIQAGIRNYSHNYLSAEIEDELAGRFRPDSIRVVWNALQHNREAELNTAHLLEECGRTLDNKEMVAILNALFTAGAIGNKIAKRNTAVRYIFSFRNRKDSYSTEHATIIHKGLHSAFSIS